MFAARRETFLVHLRGAVACVPVDHTEVFVAVGPEKSRAVTCPVCIEMLKPSASIGKIIKFPRRRR